MKKDYSRGVIATVCRAVVDRGSPVESVQYGIALSEDGLGIVGGNLGD
jgi:hypothetical protein